MVVVDRIDPAREVRRERLELIGSFHLPSQRDSFDLPDDELHHPQSIDGRPVLLNILYVLDIRGYLSNVIHAVADHDQIHVEGQDSGLEQCKLLDRVVTADPEVQYFDRTVILLEAPLEYFGVYVLDGQRIPKSLRVSEHGHAKPSCWLPERVLTIAHAVRVDSYVGPPRDSRRVRNELVAQLGVRRGSQNRVHIPEIARLKRDSYGIVSSESEGDLQERKRDEYRHECEREIGEDLAHHMTLGRKISTLGINIGYLHARYNEWRKKE